MSQPTNGTFGGAGKGIMKVIVLAMLMVGLIGIPIALYELGTLLGVHMAVGDIESGYSFGGLMQVIYNATKVPQYQQMAQILPATGVTMGTQDVSTLQMFLLLFGLVLDSLLAYVGYNIYKRLEEE